MRERDYRRGNINDGGFPLHEIRGQLTDMMRCGVILNYYGPRPGLQHVASYPNNRANSVENSEKYGNDH